MSVWAQHQDQAALVPPGTPSIAIRQVGSTVQVSADGVVVHTAESYRAAHLWTANTYQLTSTPMTVVYADYAANLPAPPPVSPEEVSPEALDPKPNKYRKSAAQGVLQK